MFRGGFAIQGFPTGLSPGTYDVGMVGKRSSFSSRIASCQHGCSSELSQGEGEGGREEGEEEEKRRESKGKEGGGEGRMEGRE